MWSLHAANAAAQGNAHTGRMSLEGANHQFAAIEEIETDPVQIWQRVEDKRAQIGGIGDAVAFARKQATGLVGELGILLGLAAGQCGGFEHEIRSPRQTNSVAAPRC